MKRRESKRHPLPLSEALECKGPHKRDGICDGCGWKVTKMRDAFVSKKEHDLLRRACVKILVENHGWISDPKTVERWLDEELVRLRKE